MLHDVAKKTTTKSNKQKTKESKSNGVKISQYKKKKLILNLEEPKEQKTQESQRYSDKTLTHISLESQKETRKKKVEAMMKNTMSQISRCALNPKQDKYKEIYTQVDQNTIAEMQSGEKSLRTAQN